MLGELIGEENGEATGVRVLSAEGGHAVLETSFRGSGTLLGVSVNDIGTYHSANRDDGTLFGEGEGVTMTEDGDTLTWHGSGVGRFTPTGGVSWRGAVFYETTADRFLQLNGIAAVFEFETDPGGKIETKIYEWK
ncbi:hypothetical protein [Streptomyces sp. NRRL S-87]|uniref:hypothetical protein n=1 Tax=Streptomyces sp. NRRL S-87 TaxID=1463920 RepID=UPI0004BEC8F7|nr:hypothetical protein [Streptomyces sp. NRRL S-87]